MKTVDNSICASIGFKANGIHCGIRKNKSKKDLSIIVSEVICDSAAVYTTNKVKGAPIVVTKHNLSNGKAQAVICNSGNANTCNENGIEIAEAMCSLVEEFTGIKSTDVIVASTGVIGQKLDIAPIKNGMSKLVDGLDNRSDFACEGIMTTDTVKKEYAVEFELQGHICHIGGIAKGSGMIHPNMATMLVFLTSDVNIDAKLLNEAIRADVKKSFNMVSVDGDTSTNDMLSIMCNGMAKNPRITHMESDYETFCVALNKVTTHLCKAIAADGEGATKLIEVIVNGAVDDDNAAIIAKSVACSSLLKAAMFGSDANWGRVLCAIGYSDAVVDVEKIDVSFASMAGTIPVCKSGSGVEFDEDVAKKILSQKEIQILINCNDKEGTATAWGCDLTYDYVKINGDYRT